MNRRILDFGVFSFYKDLTVGDVKEFTSPLPEKEYETITLQSKINDMRGMEDKKIEVKSLSAVRIRKQRTIVEY